MVAELLRTRIARITRMGRLKAQNLAKIYLEICQELENSASFDDHDDLVATLDGFADALVEGVADVDTVDGEMAVGVFSFGK